jgi:tetratricopeptide (TPR) repeat protein
MKAREAVSRPVASLLVGAMVAACGTTEPRPPAPREDVAAPVALARPPAPTGGFEQRLHDRALTQGRQGRLADAATSWELLTVLRPNASEYRDGLNETRRLIDTAVAERLQRAQQALKRRELDTATAQYLSVLALQPDHEQAAEALRGIERERNKQAYLGKFSRITLTRRATADAQIASAGPAVPLDRNDLEHAAMLGTQGEFDDAIVLLERHLAADRSDTKACQLLADMYFQKAEKQLARDKGGAAVSLEKSLRLDGSNQRAAMRLKQLKGGALPTASAPCP